MNGCHRPLASLQCVANRASRTGADHLRDSRRAQEGDGEVVLNAGRIV